MTRVYPIPLLTESPCPPKKMIFQESMIFQENIIFQETIILKKISTPELPIDMPRPPIPRSPRPSTRDPSVTTTASTSSLDISYG